jgi:hypothetical protein
MTKEEITSFQQEYNIAKDIEIDEPLPTAISESFPLDIEA